MQMSDDKDIIKRILYYWSKTYSKQLKRGENYKDLNKTIGILITNYEIKELKEIDELDTKWQIMCNKKDKKILTDDLELHIIEIPKAEKVLENEEVKKANSVLHEMSEDEKLERLAELREKWDLDERSAISNARDDGKAEKTIEIAKKLKTMNRAIEDIQKATGLTKEEIDKL